jgi:hypothetical protein
MVQTVPLGDFAALRVFAVAFQNALAKTRSRQKAQRIPFSNCVIRKPKIFTIQAGFGFNNTSSIRASY